MEIKYKNLRVLGPAVLRVKIPNKIIEKLNEYIDNTIKNESKVEKLNYGERLVGDVTQEFLLELEFVKSSGWLDYLGNCSKIYTELNEAKKINLKSFWVVRQYKNEYNPVHFHNGNISGVGYLKIPKNITKGTKRLKTNGTIDFIHGSKSFLSNSLHNHNPKVGDMIIFPNYLMHTAYPFKREGERRSFSFNLDIDKKTFNVFYG